MRINQHILSVSPFDEGRTVRSVAKEYGFKESEVICLANNENTLGVSKKTLRAIYKSAKQVYRYPEISMDGAKKALMDKFGVSRECISLGAGSDDLLSCIAKLVLHKGAKVLINQVSFIMYSVYSMLNEASIIRTTSFIHKKDEFIDCINEHNPELIYLSVPNNPMGDCLSVDEVREIVACAKDSLVVLDLAYLEFAKFKDGKNRNFNPRKLLEEFDNLICVGTFSKLYALAGLRIGYALASPGITDLLYRARPPFSVNTLAVAAASVAFKDKGFIKESLRNNFKEMRAYEEFAKSKGIEFVESYTNFITFMLPKEINSTELYLSLCRDGIIVKDLSGYGLNALRITIGRKHENKRVLSSLSKHIRSYACIQKVK